MSDDLQGLVREAEVLFSQRDWDAALEKYQRAMTLDPENEEACERLARIYAIRGMISQVVSTYFQLMEILESKGELDLAIEIAHWIMKLQPESDKARMRQIQIYMKKGDLDEVIRQSLHLARLLIELGHGDQAIDLLKNSQEMAPDNLEIGYELAEMYIRHGHIQDGANQFRKIANSYLDQGNLEKASDAFKRMKLIQPDDPQLLFTLGNIYVRLNRLNDAESEFRSILRHDLNHLEALMALGNVCQQKGQFRDAILAFNKIISINPQEIVAKEKLGELYQAQGNMNEAIKNYLSAAHSYQFVEDTETAVRLYQRVVSLDPTNPTACRELTNMGAPLQAEEEDLGFSSYQPTITPVGAPSASPTQPSMPGMPDMTPSFEDMPPGVVPADELASTAPPSAGSRSGSGLVAKGNAGGGGGKALLPRAGHAGPRSAESRLVLKTEGKADGPAKPRMGASDRPVLTRSRSGEGGGGKPQLVRHREAEADDLFEAAPPVLAPPDELLAPPETFDAPPFDPSLLATTEVPLPSVPGEPVAFPSFGEAEAPLPTPDGELASSVTAMASETVSDPSEEATPRVRTLGGSRGSHRRREEEAEPDAPPEMPVADDGGAGPRLFSRGGGLRKPARPGGLRGGRLEGSPQSDQMSESEAPSWDESEADSTWQGAAGSEVTETPPVPPELSTTGDGAVVEHPALDPAGLPVESRAMTEDTFEGPPSPLADHAPPVAPPENEPLLEGPPGETAAAAETIESAPAVAAAPTLSEPDSARTPPAPRRRARAGQPAAPSADESEQPASLSSAAPSEPTFEVGKLEEYIDANDMTRAILAFRKSLQESPENAALRERLADTYLACGMLEDAATEFMKLAKADTENPAILHRLVDCFLWSEEPERAIPLFIHLSYMHRELGQVDDAFQALQDALVVQREHAQARWELAELYSQAEHQELANWHLRAMADIADEQNDAEAAIETYRKLYQMTASDLDRERLARVLEKYHRGSEAVAEYKALAARYQSDDNFARARALYERIAELDPEDAQAHEALMDIYMRTGDAARAMEQMRVLARVSRESGDLDRALKLHEEIVKRTPDDYEARRTLVDLYLQKGLFSNARNEANDLLEVWYRENRLEEAIGLLKQIIEAAPDDLSAREQLIHFYERAEETEKAVAERLNLARTHLEKGNQDEAMKVFQKALSLDERNPEVYYQMGLLYADQMGDAGEAEARFLKVKELDPTHREAMKRLVHLQLKLNKPRQAIQTLNELIKVAPENAAIRDEILADYKKRVQEHPEDAHGRFTLGVLYKELNLLDHAIEQFQETRKVKDLLLASYNMLGSCFAQKRGFNMEDLAIKQFRKGLDTKGYKDEEYLELRYNLAALYDQRNEVQEALRLYEDIYLVDVKYRDVAEKIQQIRDEMNGGGKVTRIPPRAAG